MKIRIAQMATIFFALLFFVGTAFGHCQIPCGIYDDSMRIKLIAEHIATIDKSMIKIKELEQAEKQDINQQVRWIMNKEDHADKLQEIVTQYFLTQRIKPEPHS